MITKLLDEKEGTRFIEFEPFTDDKIQIFCGTYGQELADGFIILVNKNELIKAINAAE